MNKKKKIKAKMVKMVMKKIAFTREEPSIEGKRMLAGFWQQ